MKPRWPPSEPCCHGPALTPALTSFCSPSLHPPTPPFSAPPHRHRAPYTQGLNLEAIGAATDRRGFVPVSDKMEVLDTNGKVVPNVYCIGDANGKYMLAHAASAQVSG